MIKTTFTSLIFMFFITSVHAQHLWYENETDTKNILYQNSTSGTFTLGEVNPNITGINTNTIVSRFTRDVDASSAFTNFRLSQPIENVTEYSISLDAYIDRSTAKVLSNSSRFRVFLESSTLGGRIYKQLNFTEGEEWQNFNFTFGEGDFAQDILTSGGYDIMTIGYANGQSPEEEIVYYFDNIYGSSEQTINSLVPNPNLDWLTGSWGITFPVFGGERLDDEVSVGYNHLDGADEIVEKLPEVGHVITNLSYFAHSHYFTLSENSYVDVATEIHPSMVPNEDNDEIIFDVLQKFKDSGKKVILYISTNYFERADEEVKEAWVAYYTDKFGGDEYLALIILIECKTNTQINQSNL